MKYDNYHKSSAAQTRPWRINSAIWSPQDRPRLIWENGPVFLIDHIKKKNLQDCLDEHRIAKVDMLHTVTHNKSSLQIGRVEILSQFLKMYVLSQNLFLF